MVTLIVYLFCFGSTQRLKTYVWCGFAAILLENYRRICRLGGEPISS